MAQTYARNIAKNCQIGISVNPRFKRPLHEGYKPGTTITHIRLNCTLFGNDNQPCALTDCLHNVMEDNLHVPIRQGRLHGNNMDEVVHACTNRATPTVNGTQRRHVGMEDTTLLFAAHKPPTKKA